MSYIFHLIGILFFITSTHAQAQTEIQTGSDNVNPISIQERGKNIISCSSYEAIAYKKQTISQINSTKTTNSAVQTLFGVYTSVSEKSREKVFMFGTNKVAFNTEYEQLTRIEIKNNHWSVKILGEDIQVGDHFNNLKEKFGSELKIIYKPEIDPNYVVSFSCSSNDYDGILIEIDVISNKVKEIIYFVIP